MLKVPNLNVVDNVQRLAAESLMTFSDDLKIGRKIHLYGKIISPGITTTYMYVSDKKS